MIAAPHPTPAKHFTDEELKQQYGIHLATRLQADADGKEAKWADIDDDEDDWAPETIEWNDGTKIDLSQTNAAALLAEEQARARVEKERQEEERKSKLAAQAKPTTTVGPNATVLKPRSTIQPKPAGLVTKPASEKPTLVAKPAAPAPVRSPWAALPPVDKVPPVEINPPVQTSTVRSQQTEIPSNIAVNAPPQPQHPAMQIAADDFTRTRRDNQNAGLGQLYNAQSGQYEPANAGRRGSVRKEQNFRAPSVLQRGATNDQQGPAEPSAAFQTRRGSSTVSGESGLHGRRTSTSKGSELSRIPVEQLQQRRESQPLVSPSTPSVKQEGQAQPAVQSPSMNQAQSAQDPRSATASPYRSRNTDKEEPPMGQRDDVAIQKAIMKEKRELAIKRKKEQEEQEEAAKKERIRLRMEKLGMAPLEEKKEEPDKKTIEKREPPKPVDMEPKKAEVKPDEAQIPKPAHDLNSSAARSPPKPPVPDASGPPQQYGMMKLHSTASNSAQPANERPKQEMPKVSGQGQKTSPPIVEGKPEVSEHPPSPLVNGVATATRHPDAPVYKAPDNQNQMLPRESRQPPWNNTVRDQSAYNGWNGQNMTREPSVTSSVWGPSTHSRALGNGTFDRSIQRPQSKPQEQFTSPALAPIGPPKHLQRQREASNNRNQENSQNLMVEDFQTIPTFPPLEGPKVSPNKDGSIANETHKQKDISPPKAAAGLHSIPQLNHAEPSARNNIQQQNRLAAWNNFQITDMEKARQLEQAEATRRAEDLRNGVQRPAPQLPIMNETWRQVKVDENNPQRQFVGVSREQNTHNRLPVPQVNGDIRGPSLMAPSNMLQPVAAGMGRGSRFFPAGTSTIHPQYQGPARFAFGYRRLSSPPPPEDEFHFHPAYSRDYRRPLVKFPSVQDASEDTTPKVRLPPANVSPMPSPQLAEVRAIPLRAASQPLVNNPSWQDRFNGLLGVKKTSPDSKFVPVADGFSATKVPIDHPLVEPAASVSLPPQVDEPNSRALEPASKLVEDEEALFENREFGSLPAVSIPSKVPEVGWMDAKTQKRGHNKQSRFAKEVEPSSRDTLVEKEMLINGNVLIFVRMLGMDVPKSVAMPRPTYASTAQGATRQRNFSGASKPSKPFKPTGNMSQAPKPPQGTPLKNLPHVGPIPQPRGHASRNHPAWGARTANAVH